MHILLKLLLAPHKLILPVISNGQKWGMKVIPLVALPVRFWLCTAYYIEIRMPHSCALVLIKVNYFDLVVRYVRLSFVSLSDLVANKWFLITNCTRFVFITSQVQV